MASSKRGESGTGTILAPTRSLVRSRLRRLVQAAASRARTLSEHGFRTFIH